VAISLHPLVQSRVPGPACRGQQSPRAT
jgi:hypothetical protein